MAGDDFHEQTSVPWIGQVDTELVELVVALNEYGLATYESCQNYGEYLRHFGDMMTHMAEAQRDYAYIEFFDSQDAVQFLRRVRDHTAPAELIHQRVTHHGAPGAWEVRINYTSGDGNKLRTWVWFPAEDIQAATTAVRG